MGKGIHWFIEKLKEHQEGLVRLHIFRGSYTHGTAHVFLMGEFPSEELANDFYDLLKELFEIG